MKKSLLLMALLLVAAQADAKIFENAPWNKNKTALPAAPVGGGITGAPPLATPGLVPANGNSSAAVVQAPVSTSDVSFPYRFLIESSRGITDFFCPAGSTAFGWTPKWEEPVGVRTGGRVSTIVGDGSIMRPVSYEILGMYPRQKDGRDGTLFCFK